MDKTTTFLLADDHSLIRQGIEILIEDVGFKGNILHASNLSQLLEIVTTHPVEIAIIDAHFPDGNSLNILPEIRRIKPDIKIMMFTGVDENTQALKYINAGANGFISKLSDEKEIMQAILKMKEDGEYISPSVQSLLMNSIRNRSLVNPLFSLTERELEIAKMYAKGYGNLEIANNLNIKQNTVSTIKKRIFDKLNIDNIVELIDLMKDHH
ncbi:response regulator [Chryseobacterium sp. T1]